MLEYKRILSIGRKILYFNITYIIKLNDIILIVMANVDVQARRVTYFITKQTFMTGHNHNSISI